MKLKDYLAAIGDEAASKMLGITPRAARSYRTGKRLPRPPTAAQIVKRSRGKVRLEDIYG